MTQELTGMEGLNRQYRVSRRGGWGAAIGESMGRAVERALAEMNRDGYKPIFDIQDEWSFGRKLLNFLIWVVTLGFYAQKEDVIIIAERADS